MDLKDLKALCISHPSDIKRWNNLMLQHHYLPFRGLIGRFVRHAVVLEDQWLALLAWQGGAFKTKSRDQWVGWSPEIQFKRLHLIAHNSRFCVLETVPNLASRALALSLKRLPTDMEFLYGHTVFLAETFVDPSRFKGCCYKANGWKSIGFTRGFSRLCRPQKSQVVTWEPNQSPKEIFMKELRADAREKLSDEETPAKGALHPKKSTMKSEKMGRLYKFFKSVPDFRRDHGKIYPMPYLLALRGVSHLCGYCGYKKTVIFAKGLTKGQLKKLGAPRDEKIGEYLIPAVGTLHNAFKKMDHVEFQKQLNLFNEQHLEVGATASLDGKYLRGANKRGENIGESTIMMSAMVHGTNIVIDQELVNAEISDQPGEKYKENEIPAARRLIKRLARKGCTFTMDAMHSSKETAQLILDNLCNYTVTIKKNQPTLWDTLTEFDVKCSDDRLETQDDKHGRKEYRKYVCFDLERGKYKGKVDYPGALTAIRVYRKRKDKKTGKVTEEVSFILSSLSLQEYSVEEMAEQVRGHWGIENSLHHVRDVAFREDHNQSYVGSSPIINSQLNNLTIGIIALKRGEHSKYASTSDIQAYYAGSRAEAIDLFVKPIPKKPPPFKKTA